MATPPCAVIFTGRVFVGTIFSKSDNQALSFKIDLSNDIDIYDYTNDQFPGTYHNSKDIFSWLEPNKYVERGFKMLTPHPSSEVKISKFYFI